MLNNFIHDIAVQKSGQLLDFPENELSFNSYIVQRIISMYSPNICFIINETTNKKLSQLSKEQVYKLLIDIIPKQKNSFTKYFKKDKTELILTDTDKKNVDFLCEKYKISYREVKDYINILDLNINFLK
jgi:hypothetical protein